MNRNSTSGAGGELSGRTALVTGVGRVIAILAFVPGEKTGQVWDVVATMSGRV